MTSTTAFATVKTATGDWRWFSSTAAGVHETVANWIRKRFESRIEDVHLPNLVAYDNAPEQDYGTSTHALCSVRFLGVEEDPYIGDESRFRITGEVEVVLRSQLDKGDGAVRALADTIAAEFRGSDIPVGIHVEAPSVVFQGPSSGWNNLTLVLPFYYHDRTARSSGDVGVHDGTWATLGNTIRAKFNSAVATPHSLSVAYDNSPHDETALTRWARWSIQQPLSELVEGTVYRTSGTAFLQVFVKAGTGDASALEAIDTAYEAFKGTTLTGVQFHVPSARSVGRSGPWWQVNLACPFTSYHHA